MGLIGRSLIPLYIRGLLVAELNTYYSAHSPLSPSPQQQCKDFRSDAHGQAEANACLMLGKSWCFFALLVPRASWYSWPERDQIFLPIGLLMLRHSTFPSSLYMVPAMSVEYTKGLHLLCCDLCDRGLVCLHCLWSGSPSQISCPRQFMHA